MGKIYRNQEQFLSADDLEHLASRVRAAEARLRLASKCEESCEEPGPHGNIGWEVTGSAFELNGREYVARAIHDPKAQAEWRLGLFIESIPIVEG